MIEVNIHRWRTFHSLMKDGSQKEETQDLIFQVDAEEIRVLQRDGTDSVLVLQRDGETVAVFKNWDRANLADKVTEQPSANAVGDTGDAGTADIDE